MLDQVEWAIKKAQDAIADFDADATKNYLEMSRLWLGIYKRSLDGTTD